MLFRSPWAAGMREPPCSVLGCLMEGLTHLMWQGFDQGEISGMGRRGRASSDSLAEEGRAPDSDYNTWIWAKQATYIVNIYFLILSKRRRGQLHP